MQLRRLTGALGIEVTSPDIATAVETGAIWDLISEYLVCVFPEQPLGPADHIALARRLGEIQVHAYHADAAGPFPEMLVMDSDTPIADFWHADETFEKLPPTMCVLRVVQAAETGGDTLWSNQYLAYESLSSHFQRMIDDLSAWHVTPDGDQAAQHSVVRVHPKTGRKALNVNRQFAREIVGLTSTESRSVLDVLLNACESPDVQCRYTWSSGAMAIWDNRWTQHRVAGDYTTRRRSERIAVICD